MFYNKGEHDCALKGATEPGSGEKRFTNEAAAIRSAKNYVTKGEQKI